MRDSGICVRDREMHLDPTANLEVRGLCSDITPHLQQNCVPAPYARGIDCNQTISDTAMIEYTYDGLETGDGGWSESVMTLTPVSYPLVYTITRAIILNIARRTSSSYK